jgi:hypothetical protein
MSAPLTDTRHRLSADDYAGRETYYGKRGWAGCADLGGPREFSGWEKSALLQSVAVSAVAAISCDTIFNIDASLAADIIPRGWKVRQAWQSRLSVPNRSFLIENNTACPVRIVEPESGLAIVVFTEGFCPRTTAAAL